MTLEIQGHIDAKIIVGAEIQVGWRDEDTHLFARTTDTGQAAS
jgi:hypothetical protein